MYAEPCLFYTISAASVIRCRSVLFANVTLSHEHSHYHPQTRFWLHDRNFVCFPLPPLTANNSEPFDSLVIHLHPADSHLPLFTPPYSNTPVPTVGRPCRRVPLIPMSGR